MGNKKCTSTPMCIKSVYSLIKPKSIYINTSANSSVGVEVSRKWNEVRVKP